MEAIATHNCQGVSGVSYIDEGVCLDWESSSGVWEQQNCASNSKNKSPWTIGATTSHYCTEGQSHNWRTRGNGHVTVDGTTYAGEAESTKWVKCY
jgi:hypothetical protein